MGNDATKKEQVQDPSPGEQDSKPSDFKSMDEALAGLRAEQAKKPSEKTGEKAEESQDDKKPCTECSASEEEILKGADEPTPVYWVVDEKGNKTPLIAKADGKTHVIDTLDKLNNYLGLGIHGSQRLEEIKKVEPIMNMVAEAYKDGRLVIEGKRILPEDEEKKATPKEEDDELDDIDPELAKHKKELKKTRAEMTALKEYEFKKLVKEKQGELERDIAATMEKGKMFAAIVNTDEEAPAGVYNFLAELDEAGKPKYNLEQSVKLSHERALKFAKGMVEKYPEECGVNRQQIYLDMLKEKQDKEKAPVSPPSDIPTETSKDGKVPVIKSMEDAELGFNRFLAEQRKAGEKLT